METGLHNFMPILFKVLFGFVIFNIVVNLVLLYLKKRRLYKLLATFWPTLLFAFILESYFQVGNLPVTLGYSANIISLTIISMIGFEAIGKQFPLKKYIVYYALFFPLTFLVNRLTTNFTLVAMPFAIATATPLIHAFISINFLNRKTTTSLQKILGFVYFLIAVHCINFALFRMVPDAQLWGWLTTYAICDMQAILLPSIALEEANLTENDRLNKLVDERTAELNSTIKVNDNLLKVLLHDISNPLLAMKFYLNNINAKALPVEEEAKLSKVKKSQLAISEVLGKVREIYTHKWSKNKLILSPLSLEDCFDELAFLFSTTLEEKNISLVFQNKLDPGTKVLSDRTSLIHSVLSNLISNAIKFSSANSEVAVVAKEERGSIAIEVTDKGPGIPDDIIQKISDDKGRVSSSAGTSGETGQGFGLTIAKSFVDSYGGEIEIESRPQTLYPEEHGTSIRIYLEKAPDLLS